MGTGSDGEVQRLGKVLCDAVRLDARHVWRALTVAEREAALLRATPQKTDGDGSAHTDWRRALASIALTTSRGFRPTSVRAWTTEQLASHVARLADPREHWLIERVVLEHHAPELLEVVQAPLLDRLAIRHARGILEDGALDELRDRTSDEMCGAALDTWRERPSRTMAIYLLALAVVFRERWAPLLDILPTVGEELLLGVPNPDVAGTAGSGEDGAVETAVLTPLDEELILRMADSLQEVSGAPDEARLDSIIDEVIHLNATRHQSFYLRGLHDAVRDRQARAVLPAQNADRWRWYMAGFVAGLARLDRSEDIVALWERRPELRTLGDTGVGPSRYAVVHVVKALQAQGRLADAVAFASPDAIARNTLLAELILDTGTKLQRQQRFTEASPVFERLLLAEAIANKLAPNFWATVKRRHAHCLRTEGKLEAARHLLEEALQEADVAERAMVMVDLGLIDASYARLTDLRLPPSFETAREIACQLDRGEARFREAEALDATTSSHAHYVLGMRELLRQRYADAERLIAMAVSQFDLERERYEPAQLLRRAHMHLAVARCANVESDASRLEQAVRDIGEGVADAEDLPDAFLEEVITGLLLRDDINAHALVERLLSEHRDALMDLLLQDEKIHRSTAVADALASRFRRERRTERQRMADGITLVRMLLCQARHDDAGRALDELEELAVRTPEGTQFLSYLEAAGDSLTSVWESIEVQGARVRVLESLERFDEASQVLRRAFARAMARDDAQGRLDACDILDTLAGYGCVDGQELQGMRGRAERAIPSLPAPRVRDRAIHVLIVGGNEVQAQYDKAIIAHYAAHAPWLTVEFMHTGWSSNWGEKVAEFDRRKVRAHAVVLIYLMRTEFGRAIRGRMGSTPWRGCGGRGRDSIQRAIDEAVRATDVD